MKNLGDGLMAVFGSPSAAVACAVAMQQAIEQDNRRSAKPLGLRVGLSCGETTVEDGDYFGDPVVEASRICALSAKVARSLSPSRSRPWPGGAAFIRST